MFYNVTYHHMLHFGSSKHSSNLLGFGLSSKKKKKKGQRNDIFFSVGFFYSLTFTTFFLHCTWQLGRGAGSKKKHRHAAVASLEIASYHAGLIRTFQILHAGYFFVTYLDLLLLSRPWMWRSSVSLTNALWRSLSRSLFI